MSVGVGDNPSDALRSVVHDIISWRKSVQLRAHEACVS